MNERIDLIVKKSGLTKAKFAEKIGVSAPYITMLCSGASKASDRTISDICREFGCNEVWLRTGEGEPFQQRTREEEIMRSTVQTIKGSNEFRKQMAWMFSQLDEEDWENLEKIYQKQLDRIKNSDRT